MIANRGTFAPLRHVCDTRAGRQTSIGAAGVAARRLQRSAGMTNKRRCRTCGETLKIGYYHKHRLCECGDTIPHRAPLHYIAGKPYELVLDKATGATVLAPVRG